MTKECENVFQDTFEFRKTRIICGNKGAGVGVMGGLEGPDNKRMEVMGSLFGYEGWGMMD